MPTARTDSRSALGGTAILMACACGIAANRAKLLAMAGVGATVTMLHPVFIGAEGIGESRPRLERV